jgi:hypothetical protein
VREVNGGSNYLSQSEKICHFGLGSHAGVVGNVTIDWPSGITHVFTHVPVDSVLEAVEPSLVFEGWRLLEFDANELKNLTISSALADPEGGRIANVLEFATGLSARQPDSGVGLSTAVSHSGYLEISYRQRQFLGNVTLAVEVSGDLDSLTAGGGRVRACRSVGGWKRHGTRHSQKPCSGGIDGCRPEIHQARRNPGALSSKSCYLGAAVEGGWHSSAQ